MFFFVVVKIAVVMNLVITRQRQKPGLFRNIAGTMARKKVTDLSLWQFYTRRPFLYYHALIGRKTADSCASVGVMSRILVIAAGILIMLYILKFRDSDFYLAHDVVLLTVGMMYIVGTLVTICAIGDVEEPQNDQVKRSRAYQLEAAFCIPLYLLSVAFAIVHHLDLPTAAWWTFIPLLIMFGSWGFLQLTRMFDFEEYDYSFAKKLIGSDGDDL